MIEKQLARHLIPLVNGPEYEFLQAFVKARMDAVKSQLLVAVDLAQVNKLQGAYAELSMLSQLKAYVDQDKE